MTKMKMKKIVSSMLLALCVGMVYAPSAFARSAAGILGSAYIPGEAHCFDQPLAGPQNNCTDGAHWWIMPIVYDNEGWVDITANARSTAGTENIVRCTAWSVAGDGSLLRKGGDAQNLLRSGAYERLTSSVQAHGFGSTWMSCSLDPSTHVLSYFWNR